jgi:hypothetical protein
VAGAKSDSGVPDPLKTGEPLSPGIAGLLLPVGVI